MSPVRVNSKTLWRARTGRISRLTQNRLSYRNIRYILKIFETPAHAFVNIQSRAYIFRTDDIHLNQVEKECLCGYRIQIFYEEILHYFMELHSCYLECLYKFGQQEECPTEDHIIQTFVDLSELNK